MCNFDEFRTWRRGGLLKNSCFGIILARLNMESTIHNNPHSSCSSCFGSETCSASWIPWDPQLISEGSTFSSGHDGRWNSILCEGQNACGRVGRSQEDFVMWLYDDHLTILHYILYCIILHYILYIILYICVIIILYIILYLYVIIILYYV